METRAIERHIVYHDCRPAMADVVSGAVPRPAEWAPGQTWQDWATATPAWRRILELHGAGATLLDATSVEFPNALRRLAGDPDREELHPAIVVTDGGRVLLVVLNVDGCGVAIVGAGKES